MMFPSTLPGGYAPINFEWHGPWPANTGSIDLTFTSSCRRTGTTTASNGTNVGTKFFFFGCQPQNNHFIGIASRRYDGSETPGAGTSAERG